MRLWRIANAQHASLDGKGGMYVSGRWHSQGRPIIYTAEHPALAALEVLVHMDMQLADLLDYVLLEIDAPDNIDVEELNCDPADTAKCREMGDNWLAGGSTALCRVPSIVVPKSSNVLINPSHVQAGTVKVVDQVPFEFDGRLFTQQ
jgi:RES domain-containing protein